MKLTEKQKGRIEKAWGDWEVVHGEFDGLIIERLRELDPEFWEELEKLTENAEFWYA